MRKEPKSYSVNKVVRGAISPYEDFCGGFGDKGASGNSYILGFVLGAGLARFNLRHDGSQILDEINAFDRAEVADTNIGQINMTTVSSFCGPSGVIWGYDIAKVKELRVPHEIGLQYVGGNGNDIPVYSAKPLIEATKKLFGTLKNRKFPLLPGAHVPCAGKNFKDIGPRHIYAGIALGVAKDRSRCASLLMEDLGWLPLRQDIKSQRRYKRIVLQNIARSVVEVGHNQHVEYKEIFVEMVSIIVPEGYLGCTLVAAPYFTLAKKAIPNEGLDKLVDMNFSEWESRI